MEKYFVKPTSGYHFTENNIKTIEEKYGAKYVGYFCTRKSTGDWNDVPVDVFYQPNPDVSKGHSHYFGMLRQTGNVYITNAISITEHPMLGVIATDGEVVISRYRHDYRRSKDGSVFIDGGRDYTRYGWDDSSGNVVDVLPKLTEVKIVKDDLVVVC